MSAIVVAASLKSTHGYGFCHPDNIDRKFIVDSRLNDALAVPNQLPRYRRHLRRQPSRARDVGAVSFSEALNGWYVLDLDHASLQFSVVHAFLSNYVVRFNKFDVAVILDAANPAASSVTVNVDPTSLDTGYPGDFKAAHANSPFESWDEMLAQSDMFFEAAKYPQIVFRSTQVELVALDKLRVTGDLNLRGQIHPVMLDVTLLGATASHPFSQRPAFGISVTGTIHRSEFGMTSMIGVISDAVTVRFEGELLLPTEAGVPTSP